MKAWTPHPSRPPTYTNREQQFENGECAPRMFSSHNAPNQCYPTHHPRVPRSGDPNMTGVMRPLIRFFFTQLWAFPLCGPIKDVCTLYCTLQWLSNRLVGYVVLLSGFVHVCD